jgi:transglutaminase-like putative cysteine protease
MLSSEPSSSNDPRAFKSFICAPETSVMRPLRVQHSTVYRYSKRVTFGDHRMMLRPPGSHDLRVVATRLAINPQPSRLRWLHDVFGNSVAVASFNAPASELRFESEVDLDHYETIEPDYPIEPYAETYPFHYSADEIPDLTRLIERHYPDPDHYVDLWARGFAQTGGKTNTLAMLTAMTQAIKGQGFQYSARIEEGCQTPTQTLQIKSGTCRDFALLMMEAVRSLGLAARFVSGYLYVPAADNGGNIGGGSTHAWLQVYLPGSGWMEFDPTNGIVGNRDLIRVAVVRDPTQAIPISGNWTGTPGDFLGLSVDVRVVSRRADAA